MKLKRMPRIGLSFLGNFIISQHLPPWVFVRYLTLSQAQWEMLGAFLSAWNVLQYPPPTQVLYQTPTIPSGLSSNIPSLWNSNTRMANVYWVLAGPGRVLRPLDYLPYLIAHSVLWGYFSYSPQLMGEGNKAQDGMSQHVWFRSLWASPPHLTILSHLPSTQNREGAPQCFYYTMLKL